MDKEKSAETSRSFDKNSLLLPRSSQISAIAKRFSQFLKLVMQEIAENYRNVELLHVYIESLSDNEIKNSTHRHSRARSSTHLDCYCSQTR